ncbi:hypothetical protein [Paenibacillus roseipurpureus]|uniref:Uncharacterized protein n=1 Tax=Paenibacillus roseopurpureus TaxID=2918901 RepID=A0AA96LL80_9BACL|nr:hypothetical protein [Paenibacillus sp. MBLB1832]WNR43004.1 hypothetical protein MJB10_18020 [Paenibacillus sp. MBLB1832]
MEKLIDLFPTDQAKITEKGILFNGTTYSCSIAIREQWYGKLSGDIPIFVDNYDESYILVLLKDGSLAIALLVSNYVDASEQNIESYQERIRSLKDQLKSRKKRRWKHEK